MHTEHHHSATLLKNISNDNGAINSLFVECRPGSYILSFKKHSYTLFSR